MRSGRGGKMADFSGGNSSDSFTGTDAQDLISGGAGADVLKGLGGDDYIASDERAPNFGVYSGRAISIDTGAAVDTLQGGAGDDHLYAGYGDNVDGGDNTAYGDYLSISFLGASSGVKVDFSLASQTVGGGTIKNVENLTWVQGSNFADTIRAEDRSSGYTEFNKVYGMGGDDRLTAGYYTGLLDGGDGNDTIDASLSQYLSNVDGGAGKDTIILRGGQGAVVTGGAGDDDITAGFEIHAGDGNDTIHVNTTYYAGFVHGDAGDDVIEGSAASQLSAFGGVGRDTITGTGNHDAISTDAAPELIQQEVYDDNRADHDSVWTLGGDDLIAAGIGDDVDGGDGNDTLRLSLAGSATGVTVTTASILAGTGTFLGGTIRNVERLAFLGGTALADKFTVGGATLPDLIDGGAGADTFVSDGLELQLLGGDGNDRLLARKAGGFFDGGAGLDVASYGGARAGVTVQLIDSYGGGFIGGIDQLVHVEKVIGSRYADSITGDALANALSGGAGDDTLRGGDGNDTLDGGTGADRVEGGAGDDTYVLVDGLDTIVEAADGGSDTVRAGFDYALGAGLENLTLAGIGDFAGTGNALDNVLTGNAGANVLSGVGGSDVLVGGAGIDHLDGGADSDVYVLKNAGEQAAAEFFDSGQSGVDEIRYTGTLAGTYRPLAGNTGIEAITIGTGTAAQANTSGKAAINIDATAFGNALILTGNAGANRLVGTAFGDTIDGGLGADMLVGGAGDDTYRVDQSLDRIEEAAGKGTDTVVSDISWTLGANLENLTLGGADAIGGTGNAGANTIRGNDADNVIDGAGGGDTLIGGQGSDTYFVHAGDSIVETADGGSDRVIATESATMGANVEIGIAGGSGAISITGGSTDNLIGGNTANNVLDGAGGNDSLFGHGGADTLRGGDGNDFVYGGAGVDTLTGGAGSDQFAIGTSFAESVDTITDFVSGTDTLLVVNPYVSGYLLAGGFVNGTSARDEDDIAIYDRNSGNLYVDYDGNGPQAKVLLAHFTPGTALAASDIQLVTEPSFFQQIGPAEFALHI